MSENTPILDAINARLARLRGAVDPNPYLRQAAAGLAEVVLPARRDDAYGYLPGAVTSLWGGANMISEAVSGKSLPGGRFALELFAGPGGSKERANELADVQDPQNTGETVARVLGPLAVPVGGAMNATSTGGRIIQNTVAPFIPFRQSTTAGGMALEAGIPSVVGDVASEYLDPNYTGVAQRISEGIDAVAGAIDSPLGKPISFDEAPQPQAPVTQQVQGASSPLGAPIQLEADASPLGAAITFDESRPTSSPDELSMGATLAIAAGIVSAPTVASKAAAFVERRMEERAARLYNQSTAQPGPTGITTDAPIPGVGLTDKLANSVQDDTTIIRTFMDEVAPTVAQRTNAENYLRVNDIAFDDRFGVFARTGFDPTSGVKTLPLQRYFSDIAQMTDDQRTLFNQARWAATELDNRTANMNTSIRGGAGVPMSASNRVNFPDMDDAQLRALVLRADGDPLIKAAMDASKSLYNDAVKILERRGLITAAEGQQFRRTNPNYAPSVDFEGIIQNPLTARNRSPYSGVDRIDTNVWSADDQYFRSIMRAADLNDMRKSVIDAGLNWQQTNRNAPELFKPIKDNLGKWVETPGDAVPHVAIRRNGRLEYYRVNNPAMLDALRMSPKMSNAFVNAMNMTRQLAQSAQTGTVAAATGTIFAPTSALYSVVASSINRKPGTATGIFDALAQKATGGRVGIRGDILGTAAGSAYAAVADSIAAASGGIARSIEDSLRYGGFWHHIADQGTLRAWSTRAQQVFERSIYAEMQRAGVSNASTNAGLESNRIGGRIGSLFDPHQVFSTNKSYAPDLFARFPRFARVNEALKTALNIIANSAQSNYYRLNKGKLSQPELAYETRRLTGDPAATPSGGVMRTVNAAVPYSNVAVQGTTRLLESFRDHPAATTMGVMMAAGVPALVTVYSALMSGPDAVRYLFQELNDQQSVGGMRVFSPDAPPEQSAVVPLAQEVRPFYALALQLAYDLFTLEAEGSTYTEIIKNALGDLLGSGANGAVERAVSGVSSMVSPQTPPLLSAAAAVVSPKQADGEVLRVDLSLETLVDRGLAGVVGNRSPSDLPGSNRGVSVITGSESSVVAEQAISSFLGSLGSTVVGVLSAMSSGYRATGDVSYALENGLGAWGVRTKDRYPYLNGLLFQNDARLAINNPVYEEVQRKTKAMDEAIAFSRDMQRGNSTLTQNGYAMDFPVNMSRVSPDPTMREMYGVVHEWSKVMDRGVRREINNLRTQMAGLDQSGVSAETQRTVRNRYVRQLSEKYSQLYEMTSTLEQQLSMRAGREVAIEDIDWTKDSSQFK